MDKVDLVIIVEKFSLNFCFSLLKLLFKGLCLLFMIIEGLSLRIRWRIGYLLNLGFLRKIEFYAFRSYVRIMLMLGKILPLVKVDSSFLDILSMNKPAKWINFYILLK